jgi:hypothetical protein
MSRGDSAGPALVGVEQKQHAFGEALLAKAELGYEVESQTDFEAVVFTPSPRRWLRTRAGRDNDRLIVTIDDECQVTTRRQ